MRGLASLLLKYKLVIQVWYIPSNQRAVVQGVKGKGTGGRCSQRSGTALSMLTDALGKPVSRQEHSASKLLFFSHWKFKIYLRVKFKIALLRFGNAL